MSIPDISKVTQVASSLKDINLGVLDFSRKINLSFEDLNKFKTAGKKLQNIEKEFENFRGKGIKQGEELNKLGKEFKQAKDKLATTEKLANATKKVSDITDKVQKALLSKVPGSNILDSASKIGGILGILAAIGAVAILKLNEFVSSRTFDNLDSINNDLTKTNQLAVQAGLQLKTIDTKIQKIDKQLDADAKDYYRLNKQQETFGKDIVEVKKQANDALYETRQGRTIIEGKVAEAKKQANDALYETRQGRTIIEGKVAEAKKQANDALYETRQNKSSIEGKITEQRTSFEAKIQQVNAQIAKFTSGVSDTFQKSVNATISKIQSDIAATRLKIDAIRPSTPLNIAEINANAVAAARAIVSPLQAQLGQLTGAVGGIQGQVAQIPVLTSSVGNLAQSIGTANAKADAAMNEARNKGVPNLAPLQQQLDDKFNRYLADNNKALGIVGLNQSNLAKEFDGKLADFNRLNNLTTNQRFDEFQKQNDKALGIVGLNQSNLAKEFDGKLADFNRLNNLTSNQRFDEFQKQNDKALGIVGLNQSNLAKEFDTKFNDFQRINKESLGTLKNDLQQVGKENEDNKITISKINTKLGEQIKVNEQALPKLDQIVTILGLIPARAAAAIRPDIPTIPQIEGAAATGTCRTLQPGGCMRRAFDANADGITSNNNKSAANILDAVNTGANAALLSGQQTILERLGEQLPGGIGGKLSRFAQWAHLDRALNIINFAANVHNAAMLSNNLGQTLLSAIGNILSAIGLKNAEGQAFDIGSIINKSIE